MRMKKSQFILAVTLLAGGLAYAGTYEKMVVTPEPACGPWYVSAYGGGTFYDDAEVSINNVALGTAGFDNGWMMGAAVGLRTDKDWRFEADLSFNKAPLDGLPGEIERTSLMVNAVKEFSALPFLGLASYLGAGIGLTNVESDLVNGLGAADQTVLGYQFLGGLVFDLTQCLQVYAEYRLIGQGEVEDVFTFGPNAGSADLGWTQAALMGVRWFF